MPPANGRFLGFRVFLGDGGEGTLSADFFRYRDDPVGTGELNNVLILVEAEPAIDPPTRTVSEVMVA